MWKIIVLRAKKSLKGVTAVPTPPPQPPQLPFPFMSWHPLTNIYKVSHFAWLPRVSVCDSGCLFILRNL